jgi:hypothetical protein
MKAIEVQRRLIAFVLRQVEEEVAAKPARLRH